MDTLLNDLKNLKAVELEHFIQHIMTLKTNKESGPDPSATSTEDSPSVESLCEFFRESGIEDSIIDAALDEISKLKKRFKKSKTPYRPSVLVIGAQYYYSKDTKVDLKPVPFSQAPMTEKLVIAFNLKFGTSYNSVLVNHYRSKDVMIPWHKDDETMLDPNHPIGSLSDKAWRRFQVSLNKDKTKSIHEYLLTSRSFLVMKPGFQQHFFHQLAAGRSEYENERGERDNITLRKVLIQVPEQHTEAKPEVPRDSPTPASQTLSTVVEVPEVEDVVPEQVTAEAAVHEEAVPEQAVIETPAPKLSSEPLNTSELTKEGEPVKEKVKKVKFEPGVVDTIIFGSSLIKNLDVGLLSKYGKKFEVLEHSGAHIEDIIKDISKAKTDGYLLEKISNVFLVVGGNDVENLASDCSLKWIFEDFKELFKCARETFPNAKINVMSLIPRRVNECGLEHVHLMHDVNDFLLKSCKELGLRYVNIYTFFIRRNGRLNRKLYKNDYVHFSVKGDAVLAKVIIAVTHRPR